MQTSAQIEFNLTIADISAIYAKDYQSMLLQQAKDTYEGKCYDNQYILSIDSIVQRSNSNVLRRDLEAKVRVYVVVDATVLRFDKYDTVSGMRVNKIIPKNKISSNDLLECGNEYCRALIKLDDQLNEFKIGDTISIKVGAALLKINNTEVLINAYPFVPHQMDKIAYAVPKLSDRDHDQISSRLIPLIESKLAQLEVLDPERKEYFTRMLYSFKERPAQLVGTQLPVLQFLSELKQLEGKYVYIDQRADLAQLTVSTIDLKQAEEDKIDVMDCTMLASIVVFTFIKHLTTIIDLSTIYQEASMFEQHQYLWDLYERNRFE